MTLRDINVQHRLSKESKSVRMELYQAALDLDAYGDLDGGESIQKLALMTDSELFFLVLDYAYKWKDVNQFS